MLSCLLNGSKQFEDMDDLSKQFCDLLAPSNLLFLTKDCLNLECDEFVFARLFACTSVCTLHCPSSLLCDFLNNTQCLW